MEVLSDFNNSLTCVEDRTQENSSSVPFSMNKKGKLIETNGCTPFIKNADQFDSDFENNLDYQMIRIPSNWLKIDKAGNVITKKQ